MNNIKKFIIDSAKKVLEIESIEINKAKNEDNTENMFSTEIVRQEKEKREALKKQAEKKRKEREKDSLDKQKKDNFNRIWYIKNMIITCINCNKKFRVDDNQIPENGREIVCGSCNYTWHFKLETSQENSPVLENKNTFNQEKLGQDNTDFPIDLSEIKLPKNVKAGVTLKKTKSRKGSTIKVKTQRTKRSNPASRRVAALNRGTKRARGKK